VAPCSELQNKSKLPSCGKVQLGSSLSPHEWRICMQRGPPLVGTRVLDPELSIADPYNLLLAMPYLSNYFRSGMPVVLFETKPGLMRFLIPCPVPFDPLHLYTTSLG